MKYWFFCFEFFNQLFSLFFQRDCIFCFSSNSRLGLLFRCCFFYSWGFCCNHWFFVYCLLWFFLNNLFNNLSRIDFIGVKVFYGGLYNIICCVTNENICIIISLVFFYTIFCWCLDGFLLQNKLFQFIFCFFKCFLFCIDLFGIFFTSHLYVRLF